MTDRELLDDIELLELAAKAADIYEALHQTEDGFVFIGSYNIWNPFADDGDALRLAVACGLIVDCSRPSAGEPYKQHAIWRDEAMSNAELTRRAIVRAAAEIGRQMT
jgi:hypothetical protein